MNRRIILKTVLICSGIYLMLISSCLYIVLNKWKPDTEKRYTVLVASTEIKYGTVIYESMIGYKTIRSSDMNSYMVTDYKAAVGMKALTLVNAGDYLVSYNLLSKSQWYNEEDRIIILPMDLETRLANFIRKGSLVDIKVQLKGIETVPKTVLSKIIIEDMVDENGISLGDTAGSRKAYAKVILDNDSRNKIYSASQAGKLIYELYCDPEQKPSLEEYALAEKPAAELHSNYVSGDEPKVPENSSR